MSAPDRSPAVGASARRAARDRDIDLLFVYAGGVPERESWSIVGAAMLLDREGVTLCGAACSAVALDYRYGRDRLLTDARVTGAAGVHLSRSFGVGATLVARTGGVTAASTDISTTSIVSPLGELTSSETLRGGTRLFEERICERDEHGRVTRRAERYRTSGGRTSVRVYRYTYDSRGFLRTYREHLPASRSNGNAEGLLCGSGGTNARSLVEDRRFAYDDAGNRSDQDPNEADQPELGGRTYDAMGHLSARGTRTFGYL